MINDLCYIYTYFDPTTNVPFYVGVGKNGRYLSHIKEATRKSSGTQTYKINKIRSILDKGLTPKIIKIAEGLDRADAYELEELIISMIGRKDLGEGSLANLTAGGRGGSAILLKESTKIKRKETILHKYGVENISQAKQTKQKIKENNLSVYGYENPSQHPDVKEKQKKTNLEKYGVEYFSQTENFKQNAKQRFDALYSEGTHWIQNNRDIISRNTLKQVEDGQNYFTSEKHKMERSKACKEKSQRESVFVLKKIYSDLKLKQPRGGIWVKSDSWIQSEITRLTNNPFGSI